MRILALHGQRDDRLAGFLREESADVVALSGLARWDADRFDQLMRACGYPRGAFCVAPSGEHLGLLSRHPLMEVHCHTEGFAHGLIEAYCAGPRGYMLFLTHFDREHGSAEAELILARMRGHASALLIGTCMRVPGIRTDGQDVGSLFVRAGLLDAIGESERGVRIADAVYVTFPLRIALASAQVLEDRGIAHHAPIAVRLR